MVRAIRETVTVEDGGVVRLHSAELLPGSRVDVIILPESSAKDNRPLASFKGSARGVYASPEQADAFLRTERDQWDR
ncbi:MAG TPA: hypothetical protein VGG19_11555 [Tepidisphaeraceae bacterium]